LFAADAGRAARFAVSLGDLTINLSRSSIDDEALAALCAQAEALMEDGPSPTFGRR
jgi:hypothetical protein